MVPFSFSPICLHHVVKLHTPEMRMPRLATGKTKKDHIKIDIWREANIEPMITFPRQNQLRWYGHVLRKEGEDTTKNMITTSMQVQGKRRRGRPKKRWPDNTREDMEEYNMTEEMAENRSVSHMKTNTDCIVLIYFLTMYTTLSHATFV